MARDNVVVGLDIGSSKVCALIAEVGRGGDLQVIGVGQTPSRGLRRGAVINIDEAIDSVKGAVEKAERTSGYKIVSAHVAITGAHITSLNNRGVVVTGGGDKAIDADDVARTLEAARLINVPVSREIVHATPRGFILDGQEGIKQPIGLVGYRLDVEAHVVTASATAIENLRKCVTRLGIDVDQLVVSPLAAGAAVLSEEERALGVAVVDIGAGTTDIAVYLDGSVWHTAVVALGGINVTNDISIGIRTPFAVAEELKITEGSVDPASRRGQEWLDVYTFGRSDPEPIDRGYLCEIIEARIEEILNQLDTEIRRSGYHAMLPAGIVFTGGTSALPGFEALARSILRLPVRIATPTGARGLVESLNSPVYATSLGLLSWAAGAESSSLARISGNARANGQVGWRGAFSGGVFGWMRRALFS